MLREVLVNITQKSAVTLEAWAPKPGLAKPQVQLQRQQLVVSLWYILCAHLHFPSSLGLSHPPQAVSVRAATPPKPMQSV